MREDIPEAKRPSFSIVYNPDDITPLFSDIRVIKENGINYLIATFKGSTTIKERILDLDAKRFSNNDLPLRNLLTKYCSYLCVNK